MFYLKMRKLKELMLCPGSNALMSWPPLQEGSWKIYKYVRAYYMCIFMYERAAAHTINKNYKLYDEGVVACVCSLCPCVFVQAYPHPASWILHPHPACGGVWARGRGSNIGNSNNSSNSRTSANDLINHRVRQRNIWDICSWSVAPQQQKPQPGRADGLGIAEVVIGPKKKRAKKRK